MAESNDPKVYDDQEGADEDEFTKEYYRQQNELAKRAEENWRLDIEAQKHEIWSCKVGDLLELIAPLDLWNEEEQVETLMQPEGQIYRVDELKGRYFYLELVSGNGRKVIGMFNNCILDFFKVLGPKPTE